MIDRIAEWCGEDALPTRAEFGALYPWRIVASYARTVEHARRVVDARRNLDEARDLGRDWRLAVSCGKDSTALALLCAEENWRPRGMSVKDDLDYPGERRYLDALAARAGIVVDVLSPAESLVTFLRREGVSLVEDTHSRAAELSSTHFYGLIDSYRAREGYDGVLLGLRAEESRARRMNVATRGTLYERTNGLAVAQPLANWTALDVHAFLLEREVPLLPVYLCIDPGADPFALRKSWWIAGGGPARHGHYVWLRRWWPRLWALAVEIDPLVEGVS